LPEAERSATAKFVSQPIDSKAKKIRIADANCSDGKRFIVRADEKMTAFLELEVAVNWTGTATRTGSCSIRTSSRDLLSKKEAS
jgi:hypothetical protein